MWNLADRVFHFQTCIICHQILCNDFFMLKGINRTQNIPFRGGFWGVKRCSIPSTVASQTIDCRPSWHWHLSIPKLRPVRTSCVFQQYLLPHTQSCFWPDFLDLRFPATIVQNLLQSLREQTGGTKPFACFCIFCKSA